MAQVVGYQRVSNRSTMSDRQVGTPSQSSRNATTLDLMNKHQRILFQLGITEIVLGVLSFGFTAYAIAARRQPYFEINLHLNQGIWCGTFLIVSGVLGTMLKCRPSACLYKANLVFSTIAVGFMVVLIVLSVLAIGKFPQGLIQLISILLTSIGCLALIATIMHSAYSSACMCCKGQKGYSGTILYTPQPQQLILQYPLSVDQRQTQRIVNQQPQQMVWHQPHLQPLVLQYPQPVIQHLPNERVQQHPLQMVQQPQQAVQLANGQFVLVQPVSILAERHPVASAPGRETLPAPISHHPEITQPSSSTETQPVQGSVETHNKEPVDSPPSYDTVTGDQT